MSWLTLSSAFIQRALVEAALVGGMSGVIGVHVLLRRLSFFVVAMSHATFPGIVLASLAGVSLLVGGIGFGLVVVVLLSVMGHQRRVDGTTLTGVLLAGSFALGVLLQSGRAGGSRQLASFLVGSILTTRGSDIVVTGAVAGVVLGVLALLHKELVLSAFDPEGAAAVGYRVAGLDTLVLVVVTVGLVATVPAVGTLLAVALLTVPAMTALVWTTRVVPAMALAAAVGMASGVIGLVVSTIADVAAGGCIALTAAAAYGASVVAAAVRRALLRPASVSSR